MKPTQAGPSRSAESKTGAFDVGTRAQLFVEKRYRSSIGLARWKLDRFVSADGFAGGGTLTTVPVTHSGTRLEINARARGRGWLTVEFEDAAGRPVEGLRPSDVFRGDDLRATMTWKGKADVPDRLKNRPVRLKFRLHDCELYSFAFRAS